MRQRGSSACVVIDAESPANRRHVSGTHRGTAISNDQSATVRDFRSARRSTAERRSRRDDACVTTRDEAGPSMAGQLVGMMSRLTIRPTLALGSHVPHLPWPFGMVEFACSVLIPTPCAVRTTVALPTADAQLVRAPGVLPADGTRRVVLYLHGGAFLTCGANSHSRMVTAISQYADSPVLMVNYRLIPKHSVGMALDDCHDAYRWLRRRGYEPEQIVLAGDSAGGYLALALAQRLQADGEKPAALVMISPLLQLAKEPKQAHPNIKTDAMFPPRAFDALVALVAGATAKHIVDGQPEELYEPLDHIEPGLPPTLIHVSGSEALLHDAQLAARKLTAVGVPTEVRIWPGQIHDFQLAAPVVPEATRSLRQIGEYIRAAAPQITPSQNNFRDQVGNRFVRPLHRASAKALP
jgi:acetyl esterase/lipase